MRSMAMRARVHLVRPQLAPRRVLHGSTPAQAEAAVPVGLGKYSMSMSWMHWGMGLAMIGATGAVKKAQVTSSPNHLL